LWKGKLYICEIRNIGMEKSSTLSASWDFLWIDCPRVSPMAIERFGAVGVLKQLFK
jgi:hypothetical protein